MPVNFQSTPMENKTIGTITFRIGEEDQATVQAGGTALLTITFDTIVYGAARHSAVQNPNVRVAVQPGDLAWVSQAHGGVQVHYGRPGGTQRTVNFD